MTTQPITYKVMMDPNGIAFNRVSTGTVQTLASLVSFADRTFGNLFLLNRKGLQGS